MRGHERHSAALSGTWRHSAALRGTPVRSEALRGTPRHSEALRGTQEHSWALEGPSANLQLRLLLIIRDWIRLVEFLENLGRVLWGWAL